MKNLISKSILLFAAIVGLASCSNRFDIDKEGGVRIVAEISTKDVVKALSYDSQDPVFLQALQMAEQRRYSSDKDFVTLFGEAFEEIDPNANLVPIFLYEFKDRGININSSNSEVLKVLRHECYDAVDRSYYTLASRLVRYSEEQSTLFHKFKFNIEKSETPGRIIVELPSDANIDYMRIRKLIQNSGNLEFYETYTLSDIQPFIIEADAAMAKVHNMGAGNLNGDELLMIDTLCLSSAHPLFDKLQISEYSQRTCVGYAQIKDTSDINQMLAEAKAMNIFPRQLKLAWTVTPQVITDGNGESIKLLELVALKMPREGMCALGGEVITDARQDYDQNNQVKVTIQMNPEGAKIWKLLTGDNIGKQIAIVLDGYVFSYPVVNAEIPNGKASFQYEGMTLEEAQDLANIIKAGRMPASVRIVEETPVRPE